MQQRTRATEQNNKTKFDEINAFLKREFFTVWENKLTQTNPADIVGLEKSNFSLYPL
jgi:hypothetical protein